jgi:hypothetical protein
MNRLGPALQRSAAHLPPHREMLREAWILALV